MAKFWIRHKPDGKYVIRGQVWNGKELRRQVTLVAPEAQDVSSTMKEVVEALRSTTAVRSLAQDMVGERRIG